LWNQERASKESARQIFAAIAQLGENLARLQEQQKIDEEKTTRFRKELDEMRAALSEVGKSQSTVLAETNHFLDRIQYLETSLSANLEEKFLSRDEFDEHIFSLQQQKLAAAKEKVKQEKRLTNRVGIALGGFVLTVAPRVWELIKWALSQL